MNTTAVIEGRRVTLGYREGKERVELFADVDFSLYRGELTALLGINGAGKSTLLRTMSATQPCLSGEILLGGVNLADLSERERAQRIGVVFTEKHLAGGLRVHELVALGRYPYTGFSGDSTATTANGWRRSWYRRVSLTNAMPTSRNSPTANGRRLSSPRRWPRRAT